jgi:hypothetical protein
MGSRWRLAGGIVLVVLGTASIGVGVVLATIPVDSKPPRDTEVHYLIDFGLAIELPAGVEVASTVYCGAGPSVTDTRIVWPDGRFIGVYPVDNRHPDCGKRATRRARLYEGGYLCAEDDGRMTGTLHVRERRWVAFACSASVTRGNSWCLRHLRTVRVDDD